MIKGLPNFSDLRAKSCTDCSRVERDTAVTLTQ